MEDGWHGSVWWEMLGVSENLEDGKVLQEMESRVFGPLFETGEILEEPKHSQGALTVPGALFVVETRRARWAVPGPVDEPGFFLGEADINLAGMVSLLMIMPEITKSLPFFVFREPSAATAAAAASASCEATHFLFLVVLSISATASAPPIRSLCIPFKAACISPLYFSPNSRIVRFLTSLGTREIWPS